MPASSYRNCAHCGYQYTFKGRQECFQCGKTFFPRGKAKGKGDGNNKPNGGGGGAAAAPKQLTFGDFIPQLESLLQPADLDRIKAKFEVDKPKPGKADAAEAISRVKDLAAKFPELVGDGLVEQVKLKVKESEESAPVEVKLQRWSARLKSSKDELVKKEVKLTEIRAEVARLQAADKELQSDMGKLKVGIKELEGHISAASAGPAAVADVSAGTCRDAFQDLFEKRAKSVAPSFFGSSEYKVVAEQIKVAAGNLFDTFDALLAKCRESEQRQEAAAAESSTQSGGQSSADDEGMGSPGLPVPMDEDTQTAFSEFVSGKGQKLGAEEAAKFFGLFKEFASQPEAKRRCTADNKEQRSG